jgi:hypothetical protein
MNRALFAPALIAAFWPLAAHAGMEGAAPQGAPLGAVAPASGRVGVTPAIQLPVNPTAPVSCSSATLGTLALDSKAHLCLCDGNAWKLPDLDKPCDWKTAP